MSSRDRALAMLGEALPLPRSASMAARLVVTLLTAAFVAVGVATAVANWHLTDLKAYLAAGELLAQGGNPFDVALTERGLPYYYHYSPWFAAIFVPLTFLPVEVVRVGWSLLLLAASALAMLPLARTYGWNGLALGLLMIFLMLNLVAEGNVQPLLLAGLVWSLERRAGPVVIGVAASLKVVPILLALVYVGRGEWRQAALACVVTVMLLAPTLLFELPPTAVETGGTGLFTSAPVLWAASAALAAGMTVVLGRTRFAWLTATTAAVLALPRLLIFDVTMLLASIPTGSQGARQWRGRQPNR